MFRSQVLLVLACLTMVGFSGCLDGGKSSTSKADAMKEENPVVVPRHETMEDKISIPCMLSFGVNGILWNCDIIGAMGWEYDLEAYADFTDEGNATALLTEIKLNQEGVWDVMLQNGPIGQDSGRYAQKTIEGDYGRILLKRGEVGPTGDQNNRLAWNNLRPVTTVLFVEGLLADQFQGVGGCCGLGAHVNVEARVVQTVFIGEPDVDLETFSAL